MYPLLQLVDRGQRPSCASSTMASPEVNGGVISDLSFSPWICRRFFQGKSNVQVQTETGGLIPCHPKKDGSRARVK